MWLIRPIQRFFRLFCTRLFLSLNDQRPDFGWSRTFFSSASSPFSDYRFDIRHLELCRLLVLLSRGVQDPISGLESGRIQHIMNKSDWIRTTVLFKFPDQDQDFQISFFVFDANTIIKNFGKDLKDLM